jgi:hypothetical protein
LGGTPSSSHAGHAVNRFHCFPPSLGLDQLSARPRHFEDFYNNSAPFLCTYQKDFFLLSDFQWGNVLAVKLGEKN